MQELSFVISNYLDALVASLAFGGTFLLLKRNIETWIILNVSNLIAIPLQWSKGLFLRSVLTFILFSVAVAAWFKWRKELNEQLDNREII
jgi:nicotinamide mononucleotide transporter